MMSRAVSPVVALIILIVIAVAISSATYIFIQNLFRAQMQTTEKQMEAIIKFDTSRCTQYSKGR